MILVLLTNLVVNYVAEPRIMNLELKNTKVKHF